MSTRTYTEKLARIELSPSSAKFIDECPAGYLYNKHMLPQILDSMESESITKIGSLFHEWAEQNFSIESKADICKDANDDDLEAIETYAVRVQTRPYFAETSFANEVYVKHVLKPDEWALRGYIDRVVYVGDLVYIIDYKTTWNPNPGADIRQLRIYAYLLHLTKGIKPENMRLLLDYVQEDECCEYTVTAADLALTGNYVMSAFLRAQATIDEYDLHKDMHAIYHRPGSMCTFCHMCGNCLAYKAYHNPAFQDPDHDAEQTIGEMIEELQLRQEAVKINDARAKLLKRALLQKINEADARNDTAAKKDILSKVSVRSRKDRYIPRAALLPLLVPSIIKDGFKRQQMKDMFDTQKIETKMEELLADCLPENLKVSQVSKVVLEAHPELIRTVQRPKYLQV